MAVDIQKGDILICRDRAPKMLTTIGREYVVLWVNVIGEYPTIMNDEGRPTQYSHRWFEKKQAIERAAGI